MTALRQALGCVCRAPARRAGRFTHVTSAAMHTDTADVVVVGNGVLGSSIAFELMRRNPQANISLIGPSERDGSASTAAAAMHGACSEMTARGLANPLMQLRLDISLEAAASWPEWLEEIQHQLRMLAPRSRVAPDLNRGAQQGTFVVLNSVGGNVDSDNFFAIENAAASRKVPCERVDPRNVPGVRPVEACRPLATPHSTCRVRDGQMHESSCAASISSLRRHTARCARWTTGW